MSGINLAMPEDYEIVIILEDYSFGYYLVSWKKRCLFWLEDVDYERITWGSRTCITESHIGG